MPFTAVRSCSATWSRRSKRRAMRRSLLWAQVRASRDWLRASQASAYMAGRDHVLPGDLRAVAEAVLVHRLAARNAYGQPDSAAAVTALRRILAEHPMPGSGSGRAGAR